MSVTDNTKKKLEHFKDIGYAVVSIEHSHHVDFLVYEIELEKEDGECLYHGKGEMSYPSPVENIDDADIYAHVMVKWDGCSNFHFDEQDRVMLHGCSRKDLTDIGELLARCWDMASKICPNWFE